jgi:hypothetical protein
LNKVETLHNIAFLPTNVVGRKAILCDLVARRKWNGEAFLAELIPDELESLMLDSERIDFLS